MKTIRNNVFETNSSSMHSFCISNNEPSITQFNDLHIKIDASGEYGWGPGEVNTPEQKLDYAIVAVLTLNVVRLDDEYQDKNEKHVVRFAKGAKLLEKVRKYLSDIESTFKSHGVYIEWDEKLFTIVIHAGMYKLCMTVTSIIKVIQTTTMKVNKSQIGQ